MDKIKKGVSVIICCFNSSLRISDTLQALAKQKIDASILWEIILVDNASKDDTSAVAAQIWRMYNTGIILRVVHEPTPGLGYARNRGFKEANFSVLLFCDDDNWLAPNYIQGVFRILERDAAIAACGGMGVPVFETEEPYWFYKYAEAFALGTQKINFEDGKQLSLYGAGLAIQRNVLIELNQSGFQPLLNDRTGNKLSSAGDTELTYAIVLLGYKLYCSDELKFFHFLPKERLEFSYLINLFKAYGTDGPFRNLYYAYISNRFFHKLIKNWFFHFLLSLYRLIKYLIIPPKKYGRKIYFNWNLSYIKQLIFMFRNYARIKRQIVNLKKVSSPEKINITETATFSLEPK